LTTFGSRATPVQNHCSKMTVLVFSIWTWNFSQAKPPMPHHIDLGKKYIHDFDVWSQFLLVRYLTILKTVYSPYSTN